MHVRRLWLERSFTRICAVFWALAVGGVHADVYKWIGPDGSVHFSDSAGNSKAEKIVVPPTQNMPKVEDREPDEKTVEKLDDSTLVKPIKTPSAHLRKRLEKIKKAESSEKQKVNERICQLRYGLACDDLMHWKTALKTQCKEKQMDSCEQPQYFIRNKPPAILFRDFGKKFPAVDNTPKQDLECLLKSGFYCYELTNDAYCKDNYDVKQCRELRDWVATAAKRCKEEDKDDCDQRVMAFRPRTGEEMNKIRYGTDLAVEQDEVKELDRISSNRDKYIQKLWEIVNHYPGD